jgi:plasmid stabilization system protein ParE
LFVRGASDIFCFPQRKVRMSETDATSGKSPHAFMREALGVQARLREDRDALLAAAAAAESSALEMGTGYTAPDVDRYFAALAVQQPAPEPRPRELAALAYSAAAFEDLQRIYAALEADDPTLAANSVTLIGAAIRDLAARPLLGRPAEDGLRERVISHGRTGYVALYRHLQAEGCVLIVAIRHRYAAGYPNTEAR